RGYRPSPFVACADHLEFQILHRFTHSRRIAYGSLGVLDARSLLAPPSRGPIADEVGTPKPDEVIFPRFSGPPGVPRGSPPIHHAAASQSTRTGPPPDTRPAHSDWEPAFENRAPCFCSATPEACRDSVRG